MVGKLTDDTKLSCSQLTPFITTNPYTTKNTVLQNCIDAMDNKYIRKEPEDYSAMYWGNKMEDDILVACLHKLGIEGDIDIQEKVQHKTVPLQGSPDGIGFGNNKTIKEDKENFIYTPEGPVKLSGKGIIEAKLTSAKPTDIPDMYRGVVQAQGLMLCTDFDWCAIPTLYGGINLRIYLYNRDIQMQKDIISAAKTFQEKLDTYKKEKVVDWYDCESPFDGSNTYNEDEGLPPVTIYEEDIDVAKQYLQAVDDIKKAEKKKDNATAYFMSKMGNHKYAEGQGYKITWRTNPAKKGYYVDSRPAARSKSISIKLKG